MSAAVQKADEGTVAMTKAIDLMNAHQNFDFIQAAGVIVSIIIALIVLILNQRSNKKRETLILISSIRNSEQYKETRRAYLKVVNTTTNLVDFAKEENSEKQQTILIEEMLNQYELVALGVRMGTLDEHFYKLWYRTSLITDYHRLKPFIEEVRRWTGVDTYFYQFEMLANRWAAKPKVNQEPSLFTKIANILGL
jgi:Domain of unknown function (DUF4760)